MLIILIDDKWNSEWNHNLEDCPCCLDREKCRMADPDFHFEH